MLGEALSMLVPQVVGFKLSGALPQGATATDLVLTVTEMLRKVGVVGKFVEYFGPGVSSLAPRRPRDARQHEPGVRRDVRLLPGRRRHARLSAADRPPRGARRARRGLLQGEHALARARRAPDVLAGGRARARRRRALAGRARGARRTACRSRTRRARSSRRSTRSASRTGTAAPTRPSPTRSRRATRRRSSSREACPSRCPTPSRVTGRRSTRTSVPVAGEEYSLEHGSVVIAAITSCTNTSNPSVMIGAGLLAKKAVELGLKRKPWVKSSLAPGSKVVTEYYRRSGLDAYLDELGFNLVGYGCTTCIGNSGPLAEPIADAVDRGRPGGVRRPVREPELRGPHPRRREGELPRLAAARRRIRAGGPHGHRPLERAARRGRRRAGVPARPLADVGRDRSDDRDVDRRRDVPRHLRRRLHGRRAVARARDSRRGSLCVGRPLDIRPAAAVLRHDATRAGARSPTSTARACSSCSATR